MLDIRNCDNMDLMREFPDKHFELAIVDPNYGRGEHGGVNRAKYVKQKNGTKLRVARGNHYVKKDWDSTPAGEEYFKELFRVSRHQIIWGENYYTEQFGPGRIVWDKCNDGADQSSCEIAYNSLTDRVDMFRFMWRGMMQGKSLEEGTVMQGNKKLNEKRIHPTQKPVALYQWLLINFAKPGWKILDTHLGSGSIALACHSLGYDLTACELDPDYFADAMARIQLHTNIDYKVQETLKTTGQIDLFK